MLSLIAGHCASVALGGYLHAAYRRHKLQRPCKKTERLRGEREAIWDEFMEANAARWQGPSYEISGDPVHSACIVECRDHPHLRTVLTNFMHHLNRDWGLTIFHGPANEARVKSIVQGWGGVKLINIKKPGLTLSEYDDLFTSSWFWEQIPGDRVLIFQTDTLLRHKRIEPFIEYDYIGAPWAHFLNNTKGIPVIGNGGLSLRSREVMLQILRDHSHDGRPEDQFFADQLQNDGYHLPTIEIANSFSVETLYADDPLGMHKPWHRIDNAESATLQELLKFT